MNDRTLAETYRDSLAIALAPYYSPRLSSVATVKSIRDMSDAEIDWCIADAEQHGIGRWEPKVYPGGKGG